MFCESPRVKDNYQRFNDLINVNIRLSYKVKAMLNEWK
ncbi:hypothetical protein HMPREF9145_0862 [Segatella salivae F0493]|uniref:Uncharacterized protein n=1 Tax=Segatella salivae F0493 TaxID=1395125 RepID=U2L543_9BACT|nr:hypothetical protein HMPREF9145_0862 [Segatella salivae F0493]